MKKNENKMQLPSLDDLFSNQQERDESKLEKIIELPIKDIDNFDNHPFKVTVDDELLNSINKKGILVPSIVRQKANGRYELISGHRRKKASEILNKNTLPCIIRNFDDDEATIIMVDSNVQREKILPSEKAFAYKMKLEAIKHQGKKTLSPLATKIEEDSATKIGKEFGYLIIIVLSTIIDRIINDESMAIRTLVLYFFIANESISILENWQSIGLPVPKKLQQILEKLRDENDE